MKKTFLFVSIIACCIVFCSCGSDDNTTETQEIIEEQVVEEQIDSAAIKEAEESQRRLDDARKSKAVKEIVSWGARSAKFDDDNYFVVGVYKSDINASADYVAEQYYNLYAEEVPCMKGCIIIDAKSKKELGRYPNK